MHTFSNFFFQLSLLRTTFKCFHRPQIETQIAKNGPHWKVTVSTARRRAFTWNTKGKTHLNTYLITSYILTWISVHVHTYLPNVNMRMIKTSTPFKITIHIANYFLCLHFYTDWNNFFNKDGLSDSDFFFNLESLIMNDFITVASSLRTLCDQLSKKNGFGQFEKPFLVDSFVR